MSIIYGIIDFGEQVDKVKAANEIYEGCKRFEHLNHNRYIDGHAVLGCLKRINTPQSENEQLPFDDGRFVISCYSRIDAREALLDKLQIPHFRLYEITDSELILKSYYKWGKKCVDHLIGDWVFAIWDKVEKELFLARDQSGNTGCLYIQSENYICFCSNIHGLLNLSAQKFELDYNYLLNYLLSLPNESEKIAFKGISYLAQCSYICLSQQGVAKREYWNIYQVRPRIFESYEECQLEFLKLFKASVKDRMRSNGRIGSTLSGGLDSGSVSIFASSILKEEGLRLKSYVAVPEYDYGELKSEKHIYDEWKYAQATAEHDGNIDLHTVSGNEYSVMRILRNEVALFGNPVFAPSNSHWVQSIFSKAKEMGINTVLNGQIGNLSVSWTGEASREYLFSRFKQFLKHSSSFIDRKRNYVLYDTVKYVANNLISKRKCINRIHSTHKSRAKKIRKHSRFKVLFGSRDTSGLIWQSIVLASNIESPDPTSDLRILRFCASLPNKYYTNNAGNRMLIRTAMKGKLPDMVRLNEKRGYQGIDGWKRLVKECNEIKKTIEQWKANDDIIMMMDLEYMLSIYTKIIEDQTCISYLRYGPHFLRALSLGVFIEMYQRKK